MIVIAIELLQPFRQINIDIKAKVTRMLLNRHFCVAALALIFLSLSAGSAQPAEIPKQISYWGVYTGDADDQGVTIQGVMAASPAAEAGLQAGNILLSINRVAVRSSREFSEVKNSFPLYTPLKLLVKRNGTLSERRIMLSGITPLKVMAIKPEFIIPGVPAPPVAITMSALEALETVNVLDQVVLDPKSGKIAILGHYDSHFNTGAIPYLDILKTAMVYPQPIYNLHNTPDVNESLASFKIRSWEMEKFILGHPEVEHDRQLFIRELALLYGLSPEEFVSLYNYVHFAVKGVTTPPDIRAILVKALNNLGYIDAALAYDLVNQGRADDAAKALNLMRGGDAKTNGTLSAEIYLAIMEKINVPMATVAPLRDALIQGRSTWQEVASKAQSRLLPTRSSTDNREIMMVALTKVMLTEKAYRLLSEKTFTGQTVLDPVDLDRTSQLARIMYEADFSLKSVVVMPHLFRHVPGNQSQQEYLIHKNIDGPITQDITFWFEPKSVAMTVSPDRQVVSFGLAEMKYSSKYTGGAIGEGDIFHFYDDWCNAVMNNYDEYARILPAFHKIRETAKVIALANWLITDNVLIDLNSVKQEKWDAPDKVSGFWRIGSFYRKLGKNGPYESMTMNGYSGGVTFRPKSNWTQVTPSTTSETSVAAQLILSAGLGQKAVKMAQVGNLEEARYLAEQSAQAMNGSLSKADIAKIKLSVPQGPPMPVLPSQVQLQKELLKATHTQIKAMTQSSGSGKQQAAALDQLNNVYDSVRDNPVSASNYLLKLQTGQLNTNPAPLPVSQLTATAKPLKETPCDERSIGDTTLSAERKEYLTKKLSEARDRLRYINEALKKLIAINATQRAEIDKLTDEITEQYNEAKDRAWDVTFDLLTSISLDAFGAEQVKRVKGIEEAIKGKIALKTTPLDTATLQKVEAEIKLLQSAKFRSEEAYTSTQHLIDTFKVTKYGKDIDDWRRKNQDTYNRTESNWALIGNLALEHPSLERWLGKKSFFYGEKLWQVAAMGKMTYYACEFFGDIIAQLAVWGPMTNSRQNELKHNVQAMEHLRQSARKTSQEIGCMETLLK